MSSKRYLITGDDSVIGGGVGLALCCDLRICSDNSKFGVPAAKLGLGYGYKGIKKLVDVVGPSFAKEIFYTARQFTAAEALTIGLVNRVVPDDKLEEETLALARRRRLGLALPDRADVRRLQHVQHSEADAAAVRGRARRCAVRLL